MMVLSYFVQYEDIIVIKIKKCDEGDFGFYPELLLTSTKNLVVQKKVRDKVGCKSSDIGLILYIVISMCIEQ